MKSRKAVVATAVAGVLAVAVPIFAGTAMKPDVVDMETTKAQFMRSASEFEKPD